MISSVVENPWLWSGLSLILLVAYRYVPARKKDLNVKFVFLVLAAGSLAYGTSIFLKEAIAVPRPCTGLALCPTDFSFPSSHASVGFAALGVLGLLTTPLTVVLAAVLAVSRVFEGVHTWTDVVAGTALGLIVAGLIYACYPNDFKEGRDGHTNRERRDTDTRRR